MSRYVHTFDKATSLTNRVEYVLYYDIVCEYIHCKN